MKVADVMTRQVITIEKDAPISKAVRLLLQHRISGLPVVDADGNLEGIVTEGDFLRRAETGTQRRRPRWLEFLLGPGRLAQEYVHTHGRRVGRRDDPPRPHGRGGYGPGRGGAAHGKAPHQALSGGRGRQGSSASSAAPIYCTRSPASPRRCRTRTPNDARIRDAFFAEVERQPWAPRTSINPVVRNGVVELWGNIFDEREREALCVMARRYLDGVKDVQDHLVWIDPASGFIGLSAEDEKKQASS